MIMPIVSMNKMAMNESVATTCCYREVATPTATYWEVLNGGWIGSGYVEGYSYKGQAVDSDGKKILDDSWLNYGYDVIFGSNVTISGTKLMYDYLPGAAEKTWYGYNSKAGATYTMSGGIGTSDITINRACTHKEVDCKYRIADIEYKSNQHFESKTAHDTGNYKVPHDAKQFAS